MKYLYLLLLLFFTICINAQNKFVSDSLDNYISTGMKDWQIPGLAIVIVKDGKIVKMKGYGVSNIETNEAVNENTLFMIASNSKLFTGMALANLDYYKKISLNDKITKYYPNYKLYDKLTTEQVSIRDLLSHRIGTKTFQGDFTFWNTKLTSEEIMNKMQLLKPIGIFRQDFGYCNSCFLTAGMIIPKATNGISWEQFVIDSFIKPIGMKNTYALGNDIEQKQNKAYPYTTNYTNTLRRVPFDQWDNLAPAASIISNVNDLSKWLFFQLDSGRVNGNRIMPFAILQKTRDVNIITGSRKSSSFPIHFRGYGLGVFAADYNGKQIYWHTGGAGGMVSNVCFVPEEKLGIAILTNNDNQNFFEALRYQILDSFTNVPYTNRSQSQLGGFNTAMNLQVAEIENWKSQIGKNKAALPLQNYVGKYSHPLYGNIDIYLKDNLLNINFNSHNNLNATLQPINNNNWLITYNNIEYGIFSTNVTIKSNKVKSITIKMNDFVEYDSYEFVKK